MILDEDHRLDDGFRYYATQYKKAEGKTDDVINKEVDQLIEV